MANYILDSSRTALEQAAASLRRGDREAARAWLAQLPSSDVFLTAAAGTLSPADGRSIASELDDLRNLAHAGHAAWAEEKHPRWPASDGQGRGGQFAPKQSTYPAPAQTENSEADDVGEFENALAGAVNIDTGLTGVQSIQAANAVLDGYARYTDWIDRLKREHPALAEAFNNAVILAASVRGGGLSPRFIKANESMSPRAANYQSQITGNPADLVYEMNGVRFDGFDGKALLEAKGPGFANFLDKSGAFESFFNGAKQLESQALRQLKAAKGVPIEWHVAEPRVANAIRTLLQKSGAERIKVLNTLPNPEERLHD
jgi:hypothetical protein